MKKRKDSRHANGATMGADRRRLTAEQAALGAHPADKTDYAALAAMVREGLPAGAVHYTADAPELTAAGACP